ncbi:hypothetical protein [Pararhizobium sp. PWRC1-1]|uniref:hypothetical protein n=1 Tax=Pararhizobium sp. PWRC1-1 TaxID=2804566 RepID=UPI003CE95A69
MTIIALLLAGAVPTAPENKPAIPDYFGGNGTTGQPAIIQCNPTIEDANGQFKTCRYDCGKTLTIGARVVCPFVLQR